MGKIIWTDKEWELAIKMRQAKCTYFSIALTLGKTLAAVENKFRHEYYCNGVKGEKKRTAEPVGYIINTNIHQSNGKVNPFELARAVMFKRFSKNKIGEHFDGRLIRGMQDWDNIIMPELNKVLKNRGEAQIDYNPTWVR